MGAGRNCREGGARRDPGRLLALELAHGIRSSLVVRVECWARGVTFLRQVAVGGRFIADFLAPSIGLIVEVDGAYHARRQGRDARRDLQLSRCGFRVLRVSAELVRRDLAAAVALIRAAV